MRVCNIDSLKSQATWEQNEIIQRDCRFDSAINIR